MHTPTTMDQNSLSLIDANDGAKHATKEYIATTSNGRKRTGALWIPQEVTSSTLISFGHGASGNRYQAPIPYLAGKFVKEGCVVLSLDGPVHGLRQVGPGGREAFGAEMRRETMIDDMNEDWRFGIDVVQNVVADKVDQLAYFGLSMGSIFGIPMLADNLRQLPVSVATLGLLGSEGLGNRLGSRLIDDAKKVTCPVLFLMQLEDELFTREGYLSLFDALGSEDKRLHANPGLHSAVPGEEMRFSFEFMLKVIKSS